MNKLVTPEIKELIETVHYRPAVSVIFPFEPKMCLKTEITYLLKMLVAKVEKQLRESFQDELVSNVMKKLRHCVTNLNYNTHKKSAAIFVSPVYEKLMYMEIEVEEKIIIDESFEIKDLVYCKKEENKYLMLLLSSRGSKIFLGSSNSFATLVSNGVEAMEAYVDDAPERVSNFSDKSERKEILMDKLLYQIDTTLDIILGAYQLPLFVLGTERIAGHFKKITKHTDMVIEYIHGNYETCILPELQKLIAPYITDWKLVQQKALLNRLEDAAGKKKLATGIKDVWKEATNKNGRLLAVEKNYTCAAEHSADETRIHLADGKTTCFSCMKDAVDDVIEKVLENGGDVSFTDENILQDYLRIALVQWH